MTGDQPPVVPTPKPIPFYRRAWFYVVVLIVVLLGVIIRLGPDEVDPTTIGLVVANVGLLIVTGIYAKATQDLVKESHRGGRLSQYEVTLRTLPFLYFENANDGYIGRDPLALRNLGGSPAVDIWARGIQGEHEPTSTTEWAHVGYVLAPQERIEVTLPDFGNDEGYWMAQVRYDDALGGQYFTQHNSGYGGEIRGQVTTWRKHPQDMGFEPFASPGGIRVGLPIGDLPLSEEDSAEYSSDEGAFLRAKYGNQLRGFEEYGNWS